MSRIVFVSPPTGAINGGIKYSFRLAETLNELGYPAMIAAPNRERPSWFHSNAPIIDIAELAPNGDEILVAPEDQPQMLATLATWPQRKIIYCQNHFYAALSAVGRQSYADYGVTDILCSSQTILQHCQNRHPTVRSHLLPCAIDTERFVPAAKQPRIALIPRKRQIEAIYLQDMFHHTYPAWRHVEWQALQQAHENDIAAALGQAAVFLSLSRLDGFGLTPLEAMASGCVVAGFTGIGGHDYANAANGFWAAEDDFPTCLAALDNALTLWHNGGAALAAYHAACATTLVAYAPTIAHAAIERVWREIMLS